MLKKSAFVLIAAGVVFLLWFFGFSYVVHFNQQWLADYVATAVAEDDAEALWGTLSPAAQEDLLVDSGNDLKVSQRLMLRQMKNVAGSCNIDPDALINDRGLRTKFANRLRSNDMIVNIKGRWYLVRK